jgi:hypothetical protein
LWFAFAFIRLTAHIITNCFIKCQWIKHIFLFYYNGLKRAAICAYFATMSRRKRRAGHRRENFFRPIREKSRPDPPRQPPKVVFASYR